MLTLVGSNSWKWQLVYRNVDNKLLQKMIKKKIVNIFNTHRKKNKINHQMNSFGSWPTADVIVHRIIQMQLPKSCQNLLSSMSLDCNGGRKFGAASAYCGDSRFLGHSNDCCWEMCRHWCSWARSWKISRTCCWVSQVRRSGATSWADDPDGGGLKSYCYPSSGWSSWVWKPVESLTRVVYCLVGSVPLWNKCRCLLKPACSIYCRH